MQTVEYAIRCPKCAAKAVAQMEKVGVRGTYREPTAQMGVRRIVCSQCGYNREAPATEAQNYTLWYVTSFRGKRLWAVNEKHLEFLISWFTKEIAIEQLDWPDRAVVESFQKWMVLEKNRAGIQLSALDSAIRQLRSKMHFPNGPTGRGIFNIVNLGLHFVPS